MTIKIPYEEAVALHPEAIVQKLRSSKARDKDLPPEQMRWEYSYGIKLPVQPDLEARRKNIQVARVGRAWHWTAGTVVKPLGDYPLPPKVLDAQVKYQSTVKGVV